MDRLLVLIALLLPHPVRVNGFAGQYLSSSFRSTNLQVPTCQQELLRRNERCCLMIVKNQRWNREIEENSRKKAQGGGMGETVAGAVLGSLVLGPFGALFGASIGANFGSRKAEMEAKKAEMERLGISQDMLDMAQDVGASLEKSIEGLKAVQSSYETQKKLAKLLDTDSVNLYARAKQALDESNEELARKLLLERTNVQEKLKSVLISCAEEKGRRQKMEDNITQLERRALEIDALLRRTVSAKSLQGAAEFELGLSLRSEDPLLQKFKDIGSD